MAFVTIPGDRLQPTRILAAPSGFPLSRGRSGRLNEVLDVGSRICVLVAEAGVGFVGLSLLTESQPFRAARGGGFRKSLGRTGSDPVDTCPGRNATGLGFDSWGGG